MNFLDQTGLNDQGLRPTLKKGGNTIEGSKQGSNMSLHQRVMIKMAQEEKDNKKVDFG